MYSEISVFKGIFSAYFGDKTEMLTKSNMVGLISTESEINNLARIFSVTEKKPRI